MITNKIRVLIVDDSAFMRKSLSILLTSDPEIEIIGSARDGVEGFEMVKSLSPDLVTLDIEMPRMDGLTMLKKVMAECPTSVVMVSSLTTEGADATLKALELGAVDFIPKEMSFVSVDIVKIKDELIRKVKSIARQKSLSMRLQKIRNETRPYVTRPGSVTMVGSLTKYSYKAIGLGVSTGGPISLQKVIPALAPKVNVPVFIVQHMPPKFTKSLADRLNGLSSLEVKEAEDNEPIRPGVVYIAPGGLHMTIQGPISSPRIDISPAPLNTLHRPSVDVMMESLVQFYGKSLLGVIMTGMGKDGLDGLTSLKKKGGNIIAQDEATCVVYGMPKAVVDAGIADIVTPLEKIADTINRAF